MSDPLTRRTALAFTGLGLSVPVLAACGSSDTDTSSAPATGAVPSTPSSSAASTSASASESASDGNALGPASDVPTGGGKVYADANVVVTQPSAGTFKAFGATCTHQGCQVATVADGTINCPCHGSKYSIEDGSVVGGPAPRPLTPQQVTDQGGTLTLG